MKYSVLLLLALVGCNDPTSPEAVRAEFRANVSNVEGSRATVPVSLRNSGAVALIIPNCLGILDLGLQRKSGEAWIEVLRPDYPMCLSESIVVQPGKTLNRDLEFNFPSAGLYRLVLYNVSVDENRIPDEFRTSNEFTVTKP